MQSETTPTNSEETTPQYRNEFATTRLSEIVCERGPKLLTVGMPVWEANEAILLCLEDAIAQEKRLLSCLARIEKDKNDEESRRRKLENRLALADKILDLLPAFNVGQSFLSEERVQALMEVYNDRD